MTELSAPRTKSDVLQAVDTAHRELERVLAQFSDTQLAQPGANGWTVKDHLAHLTVWQQGLTALLQKKQRYAAMGLTRDEWSNLDMNGMNASIFERGKHQSLAEVRLAFDDSYRQLLDTLNQLDEADLSNTYSDYDPSEQDEDAKKPILNWIAGDTYAHYAEHSKWIQRMIEGAKD